jgi:hypothetical protein
MRRKREKVVFGQKIRLTAKAWLAKKILKFSKKVTKRLDKGTEMW